MAIYSGFSHKKWWFSIATLNYQRVTIPVLQNNHQLQLWDRDTQHLAEKFSKLRDPKNGRNWSLSPNYISVKNNFFLSHGFMPVLAYGWNRGWNQEELILSFEAQNDPQKD